VALLSSGVSPRAHGEVNGAGIDMNEKQISANPFQSGIQEIAKQPQFRVITYDFAPTGSGTLVVIPAEWYRGKTGSTWHPCLL
jgi:hypothetical protein